MTEEKADETAAKKAGETAAEKPPAVPRPQRAGLTNPAKVLLGVVVVGCVTLAIVNYQSGHSAHSGGGDPENVTLPPLPLIPEEDHSLMERSMALIIEGKMAEADALFKEKLTSSPFSADVHCYKAAVFAHNHQPDEAIAEFDRAILINPRFEIAYNDRGNEYDSKKEYSKAISDYSRAMLCGFKAVHWSNRAAVYITLKRYDKALSDATEAINRYNVNPSAFYIRAQAWKNLNHLDHALSDINGALLLEKDNVRYLDYRAQIYLADGQPELAAADYSREISMNVRDADSYFWRGRCELLLNQFGPARADFLTYQRLDPRDTVSAGWLTNVDDYEYDYNHKPASLARQWAIACSAQMFSKNYQGLYSLPGETSSAGNVERQKKGLLESWGIDSHDSLLSALSNLRAHGHNSLWRHYRSVLARGGSGPPAAMYSGPTGKEVRSRLSVVREYGEKFGDRGILAWDLGRYICLCRWGYKVGYISEDEAYQLIMPVAAQMQSTYGSWKQMGDEYLVGRKFWNEEVWREDESRFDEISNYLLNCKTSPWVNLAWDTRLK
jgi:tetratricopeptide (TPR) repeat protein